jgi:hypothetical protein
MMKNTIRLLLVLSIFALGACRGGLRCGMAAPAADAPATAP